MQETWVRYPGEGSGNPLQYSRLENSKDRGAWNRATVHGVAKGSDTTEQLTTTICHPFISPQDAVFNTKDDFSKTSPSLVPLNTWITYCIFLHSLTGAGGGGQGALEETKFKKYQKSQLLTFPLTSSYILFLNLVNLSFPQTSLQYWNTP